MTSQTNVSLTALPLDTMDFVGSLRTYKGIDLRDRINGIQAEHRVDIHLLLVAIVVDDLGRL